MANVKISDLPALITQLSADLYETSSAGTSYKESRQQVLDYVKQNISSSNIANTAGGTVVLTNPLSNLYQLIGNNGSNIVQLPLSNNPLSGYPLGIPLFFVNQTVNTYIIHNSVGTTLTTIGPSSSAILVLADRLTPQGKWEVISTGGGGGGGDLLASNNLSDVDSYYTSSQNLGVNSSYFSSLGNTGNFVFPARFTRASISAVGVIPVATLAPVSSVAASIQVGENAFISNVGTFPIDIWTNGGIATGTFVCQIPETSSVMITLTSNSTANGTWVSNSVTYQLPYKNATSNSVDFGVPNFGIAQIGALVPGLRCALPIITPGGDPLTSIVAGTNVLIQNVQSEDVQITTSSFGTNVVLLAASDSAILSLIDDSTPDGGWAYTYIPASTTEIVTGSFLAQFVGAGTSAVFTLNYQVIGSVVTMNFPNVTALVTDAGLPFILTSPSGPLPGIIRPSVTSLTTALCCTNPGTGFTNTIGICSIPSDGTMRISPSLVPVTSGGTPWDLGTEEGLAFNVGTNRAIITYSK